MFDYFAAISREDGGVTIMQLAPKEIRRRLIDMILKNTQVPARKRTMEYLCELSDDQLKQLYGIEFMDGFISDMFRHDVDKTCPANTQFQIIERGDIPDDRTFRDAWKFEGEIAVDLEKARDIHMNRIRAARDAALKKLDIETMKGLDVQAQKQVLRDLPANTDLTVATTPEELKAIWPDELKE